MLVMILSLSLVFSFVCPANAATSTDDPIEGMDAHFYMNEDGTIGFDTESALSAGYSLSAVTQVAERIEYMNGLVLSGKAYINDQYSAVICPPKARSSSSSYEIHQNWDGSTDIYMTKAVAVTIYDALNQASLGLDYLSIVAELDTPIRPYVIYACLAGTVSIEIYRRQLTSAINSISDSAPYVVMHIFYIEGVQYTTFYAGALPAD